MGNPNQPEPKSYYYKRDFNVIEYDLAPIHDVWVRKPIPNSFEPGTYGVVLGAEFSFAPYQPKPFHAILSQYLDFPILNLSIGGHGIEHFNQPDFLQYINQAKFVVIQLFSARGEKFVNTGKAFGFEAIFGKGDTAQMPLKDIFGKLSESNMHEALASMVNEMGENWVKNTSSFLNKITPPKILFYFSKRIAPIDIDLSNHEKMLSNFPQLVTQSMIDSLKRYADVYVDCITQKGLPNPLVDRFSGDEIGKNTYYPSAEMHELAAARLVEACCTLMGRKLPVNFVPPQQEEHEPDNFRKSHPKSYYYHRDFNIIEYDMTRLDDQAWIRKPVPSHFSKGSYGVVIGSAYSFGPYQQEPYPFLLSKLLGFPILNLSTGGNSVGWFDKPFILEHINSAKFVVIQVVSARGESSSEFVNDGGFRKIKLIDTGEELPIHTYFQQLIDNSDIERLKKNVSEMRQNWVQSYQKLIQKIETKKILFWFSQRQPHYKLQTASIEGVFNGFPQLVNYQMLDQLKPLVDHTVKCVTDSGLPDNLVDRFNNEIIRTNRYYPSKEMHQEAAQALLPLCTQIVASNT